MKRVVQCRSQIVPVAIRFLASEREHFTVCRRPSVCLLSVCFVLMFSFIDSGRIGYMGNRGSGCIPTASLSVAVPTDLPTYSEHVQY